MIYFCAILNANYYKYIELDLFNPSLGDFVLARFLTDALSLGVYFSALNTPFSLYNLKSLEKNGTLASGVYLGILKEISLKKINHEFFIRNSRYFLALVHMLINEPQILSVQNRGAIAEIVSTINSVPVPDGLIDKICDILSFFLLQDPACFQEVTVDFISKSIEMGVDHSDLVTLSSLKGKLKDLNDNEEKELCGAIKKGVEDYWENEICQTIVGDGVLDEYTGADEVSAAYDTLYDYLQDKLLQFHFSDEQIASFARGVDINDIIFDNNVAALEEAEEHFGSGGASENASLEDSSSLVDDLFCRK